MFESVKPVSLSPSYARLTAVKVGSATRKVFVYRGVTAQELRPTSS